MAESRIVVYSQPFCGFCSAAKRLLKEKGAEFQEIDVMAEAGIEVVERVAHHMPANPHNADYLATKRARSGHLE